MSSTAPQRTPAEVGDRPVLSWSGVMRFAGHALALLLLLLVPFSLVDDLYRGWFRWSSELALELCAPGFAIDFVDGEAGSSKDTAIVVRAREGASANEKLFSDVSSLWIGYAPFAVLAALLLATPIPFRSRVRLLVRGFIVLQLFLLVRLALLPVESFVNHFPFCEAPSIHAGLWTTGALLPRALSGVSVALAEVMIFHAVPIAIWLVALMPEARWRVFLSPGPRSSA